MTAKEMEHEFDILYNEISSNQAPGLNSYEKSVLLTLAQEDILMSYLNPKRNKTGEGFDNTKLRQPDLNNLLTVNKIENLGFRQDSTLPYDIVVSIETDINAYGETILFPVFEMVSFIHKGDIKKYKVIQISSDAFEKAQWRPFRYPLKNTAWRIRHAANGEPYHKWCLIGMFPLELKNLEYCIHYIRKPRPIIVDNLTNGYKIEGESVSSNCELDEILHNDIVRRASELAKAAYDGNLNMQLALGQASQTQFGHNIQNQ